jgi:hypothetical protein
MKTIQIFDPALCCSSGVCGQDVDQALVSLAADLDWAKQQGVVIERFNLAQPMNFLDSRRVSCFSPARAASARPPSPAPRPYNWRPGPARAAGQHRSGLQCGAGFRRSHRQPHHRHSRRAGLGRWRSTRRRRPRPTATASSARCAGCCPTTWCAASKNQLSGACTTEIAAFDEFTALLTDAALTRTTITSFSTPRPPATPSACCNCPAPGAAFWKRARAMRPAWGRWPAWKSSAASTRPRWMPWPTRLAHPPGAGGPRAASHPARGRPHP